MKHGDKAKSKAASKASGKKSSKQASSKSSKAPVVKAKKQSAGKSSSQKAAGKTGGNGKARGRASTDTGVSFTNPVVAAAFKRAVRKYPNAFRRLTD